MGAQMGRSTYSKDMEREAIMWVSTSWLYPGTILKRPLMSSGGWLQLIRKHRASIRIHPSALKIHRLENVEEIVVKQSAVCARSREREIRINMFLQTIRARGNLIMRLKGSDMEEKKLISPEVRGHRRKIEVEVSSWEEQTGFLDSRPLAHQLLVFLLGGRFSFVIGLE